MEELISYKQEFEDLKIEYDVLSLDDSYFKEDSQELLDIINVYDAQIQELNKKIDDLTCKADGYDYAIAAVCGSIAGMLDIFFVGEFNFEKAKNSIDSAFDEFIFEKAKKENIGEAIKKAEEKAREKGETLTKERIKEITKNISESFDKDKDKAKSIRLLEKYFQIPSDSVWGDGDGISAMSHHLDDLAHHPTIPGLCASLLTQFLPNNTCFFQNKEGVNFYYNVENKALIGKGIKEKIICGVINWIGHLISDMAGSSSSAAKGNLGMGIPGLFVSTIKELGMLPILKNTTLPKLANDLFTKDNNFLQARIDLRTELAIGKELSRQAIPIFVNEVLVRGVFFMRRLIQNCKNKTSIKDINWTEVLPVKNRTIVRMNTISLGVMECIDLTDATIRGAIAGVKAGVEGATAGLAGGPAGSVASLVATSALAFGKKFVLRINFVGIGSIAVAGFVDLGMGLRRDSYRKERMNLYSQKINAVEAYMYFKEADVWIEAQKAEQAVNEVYALIEQTDAIYCFTCDEIRSDLKTIGDSLDKAEEKNKGLKSALLDSIKWGL